MAKMPFASKRSRLDETFGLLGRMVLTAAAMGILLGPSEARPKMRPADATKDPSTDTVALLVGQTFLRNITDRDTKEALVLCADNVLFDGKQARGSAQVEAELRAMISRVYPGMLIKKIFVFGYREMVKRFGPPPKRLSGAKLEEAVFVLARLRRGGLIVVLNKMDDRWRVTALTD